VKLALAKSLGPFGICILHRPREACQPYSARLCGSLPNGPYLSEVRPARCRLVTPGHARSAACSI